MNPLERVKQEIKLMIGLSPIDAEIFEAFSKKCAMLALAPSSAAGATWGTGFVGLGSVALPGTGTLSGITTAGLMMGEFVRIFMRHA